MTRKVAKKRREKFVLKNRTIPYPKARPTPDIIQIMNGLTAGAPSLTMISDSENSQGVGDLERPKNQT